MGEEKDFVFVDKRRTSDTNEKSDTDKKEEVSEDKKDIPEVNFDVVNLSRNFISFLSGLAWSYLGLVPLSATGEIKKDIQQAKLCIDIVSSIVEIIKDKVGEEERKYLKTVVADLKINYVNIASKE